MKKRDVPAVEGPQTVATATGASRCHGATSSVDVTRDGLMTLRSRSAGHFGACCHGCNWVALATGGKHQDPLDI